MSLGYSVGGDTQTQCVFPSSFFSSLGSSSLFHPTLTLAFSSSLSAKVHPKLKSKYKGRVKDATDYVKTIHDFNELIDPQTLARHFLGPDPSSYVLRVIAREEKSKLTYLFPFF